MENKYDISDSIKEATDDFKLMNKVAENTIKDAMYNIGETDGVATPNTAPDVENDKIKNTSITEVNQYITIDSFINNLRNRREFILKKIGEVCSDSNDRIEIVISRLNDIVKANRKITDLTTNEVNELITVEGTPLTISLVDTNIDKDGFNKIFIEFLYDSSEAIREIDEQINSLETELSKFKKEVKEIVEKNASITDFTIARMRAAIESPNVPEEDKQKIQNMLKHVEDGFTLNLIKDELVSIVEKNGINSTMYGYSNNLSKTIARAHDIMVKGKPLTKLVEIPFHLIQKIESTILKDKYKDFDNLFIYLFARWIVAHRDNIDVGKRIFISQVSYNLISLKNNKLGSHTDLFTKSIKDILDIIITRIPAKMIEKKTNMVK